MQSTRDVPLSADVEAEMFDGGPPLRLLRLWGRFDPHHRRVVFRSLVVVCVGWLPLMVLALLSYADGQQDVFLAFLRDASVHARSLVVAPMLVLAEAACIPRLGAIAQIFRQRGIVPDSQSQAYEAVVRSILRLRDWWLIEALAVVLAYALSLLVVRYVPSSFLPDWHHGSASAPLGRSLASWWHALVSLPLVLILLMGWVWRVYLWALYLRRVSRLELRLVASHPEGAAGLMFVSYSLRAFFVLGMAIGAIAAATELAHVLAGAPGRPEALAGAALGTVVFVLVIFVAPLTVFIAPLMRAWEGGVVIYGALAQRIGVALEDKWMHGPPAEETADPLSTGDFSAATDFYQTANNVYTMRIMPLDLRGLLALAVATALPFSIVVLALVPFDKLLQKLIGMFL